MSSDRVVRAIRKELVPDQFVQGWIQWGVVARYYPQAEPSLTPPRGAMTVDVYLDGTQSLPNGHPAKVVTANMRFNEGYAPTVGDVVPVFRGPGQLQTDRFVFRGMAGIRGPGNGAFVGFAPGPPPPTTPWGKGDLYVDPFNYILYGCVVASVQNSSGVVTTPAFFKIFGGEGSTWGLVSNAAFSFAGNPNGHVTALAIGDLCVDDTTPALYQAHAADNSHWVQVGASSFYASLTGAGETTTPGDLTQAGGLTVVGGASAVDLSSSGTGVKVQSDATGLLSFFDVTPVVQQPSPTSLEEVVEYLANYGLWPAPGPVTFGTVVVTATAGPRTSCTWAMSGVVSGQPIILNVYNQLDVTTTIPTITDTFATPYTWTLVGNSGTGNNNTYAMQFIGTGGSGTSGTITATVPSSYPGGSAVPCIGGSIGAGLSAIDQHVAGNSAGSINLIVQSMTPSVANTSGVVGGMGTNTQLLTPPSGWTNYWVPGTGGNTQLGAVGTRVGLAVAPTGTIVWIQGGADDPPFVGCTVLPFGLP